MNKLRKELTGLSEEIQLTELICQSGGPRYKCFAPIVCSVCRKREALTPTFYCEGYWKMLRDLFFYGESIQEPYQAPRAIPRHHNPQDSSYTLYVWGTCVEHAQEHIYAHYSTDTRHMKHTPIGNKQGHSTATLVQLYYWNRRYISWQIQAFGMLY